MGENVVNTGEYYGLVGPGESHLMKTTDQWPLTGRASPVSPPKCLKWKEPSSVFQLLSPGKVPKKPLETRLEATPVKSQCMVRNFHHNKERRKMDSVKILLSEENQDKPVDEGVEDELAKINAALEAERKRVTDLDQKARDLEQEMKDLQSQRRRGLSSIKRKELEARGFNDKALFELIAANDEHTLVRDELSNIFIWIDLWKWRCEYLARGKRLNEMYLREKERKKTMRRSSSLINLSSLDGGHPSPSWCSCCGAAFSRSLSATSMPALHPASGGNAMCTTPLQHMTFRMAMARDASSSGGSTGSAGSLGERRKKKKPRFHLH